MIFDFLVEDRKTGKCRPVLVIIDVLLENTEIQEEDESDDCVVDGDEGLREGRVGRECRLGHKEEQDKGHNQVLPPIVHEEVRKPVVKPAPMMQHKPVQQLELPN